MGGTRRAFIFITPTDTCGACWGQAGWDMVQRGTEKVMSRPDKGRRVDRENGGQSRCGIWEDRVDDRRER